MISPAPATIILIVFIILFGVGIPILNKKAPKYISYRWCVVVVVLALLIGATIDFDVLNDEARHTILMGGMIIGGMYIVLRTIEKALSKGWLQGARIKVKKGETEVEVEGQQNEKKTEAKDGTKHEEG